MTAMQSYQADAITTASPAQLVLMMYDGALDALGRATRAADPDTVGSVYDSELLRAVRILAEMRGVLDFDQGGEIALNLESLYSFCIDVLADAADEGAIEPLATVVEIVGSLRDAWADAVLA